MKRRKISALAFIIVFLVLSQAFASASENSTYNETISDLIKNDNINDQNIRLVYKQLQQTNIYLTIFVFITITLSIILFLIIYKFRKKDINSFVFRKYSQIEKSFYYFDKRLQKNIFYNFYVKIKNIILEIISFFLKNTILEKLKIYIKRFLGWSENHPWKTIILFYFVIIFVKISLLSTLLDTSPVTPDAFVYTQMSRNFIYGNGFQLYGLPTNKYPPLYPIIISPSYLLDNPIFIFQSIRIINAFITTLIIFPSFLLVRKFLNNKNSIIIAFFASLVSSSFYLNPLALSENLFFTLFLFFVYFFYESFFEDGFKFKMLSGIFFGLCFLTRYISFVILPAIIFTYFFFCLFKKEEKNLNLILTALKSFLIIILTSGITILPWLIRNGFISGFSFLGILGYNSQINIYTYGLISPSSIYNINSSSITQLQSSYQFSSVSSLIIQSLLHHGFLIFTSTIILFSLGIYFLYFSYKKRETCGYLLGLITIIFMESFIAITSWHNVSSNYSEWRLMSRYVESMMPLLIIFGFISYYKLKEYKIAKIILIICSIPLFFMISHFEKYILMIFDNYFIKDFSFFLAILFIILFIYISIVLLEKKYRRILIFIILIILIFTTSLYTIKTSNELESPILYESKEIGLWIYSTSQDKNDVIFFDNSIHHSIRENVGIWLNKPLLYGEINQSLLDDNIKYLITLKNVEVNELVFLKNFTYGIYKINIYEKI